MGAALAVALALASGLVLSGAAHADEQFELRRVAGDTRYETAALVRQEFGPSARVILANGEQGRFADALMSSYLAGSTRSPVLLTRATRMPAPTRAAIEASGADHITIVGGTGAVTPGQEAALVAAGYAVDRIAGGNRYLTNAALLDAAGDAASSTALVTTGADFPDALAGGAVSSRVGMPLALAGPTGMSDAVIDALLRAGVGDFVVLGGESAVTRAAVSDLEARGLTMRERIAGSDRAQTSVLLADYAVDELGFTDAGVNVASGYARGSGADALAGGPLSGKQNRPLLITKNAGLSGDAVLSYLQRRSATLTAGLVFGGESAVEADLVRDMTLAARTGSTAPPPTGGGGNPGTDPGDPEDPGTDPTDPGTDPTDPGTDPTDPGTDPTDPGTDPGDPEPQLEPTSITLSTADDPAQRNGEMHRLSALVLADGDPVAGHEVTFDAQIVDRQPEARAPASTATDPAPVTMSTDSSGRVTFSYTAADETGNRVDRITAVTENGLTATSASKQWWDNGVENADDGTIWYGVQAAEGRAADGDTLLVFGNASANVFVDGEARRDGTRVKNLTVDGRDADIVRTRPIRLEGGVEGTTITGFRVHIEEPFNIDVGFVVDDAEDFTITRNEVVGSVDGGASNKEDGVRIDLADDEDYDLDGQPDDDVGNGVVTGNVFVDLYTGVDNTDGGTVVVRDNTFTDTNEGVSLGAAGSTVVGNTFRPLPAGVDGGPYYVTDLSGTYDLDAMILGNNFGGRAVTWRDDGDGSRHIVDASP